MPIAGFMLNIPISFGIFVKIAPISVLFFIGSIGLSGKILLEPLLHPLIQVVTILGLIGAWFYLVYMFGEVESTKSEDPGLSLETPQTESARPGIALLSDVGRVRELDEDTIGFVSVGLETGTVRNRHLMVLADGMGGHSKGELASQMALKRVMENIVPWLTREGDARIFSNLLSSTISQANKEILEYANANPECEGMGTTLTTAIVDGTTLHLGHVGDSRAYLIDKEAIKQVSTDHSLVQELLDKGEITSEQALNHPQRNVITRVVGVYASLEGEVKRVDIGENDRVLLCCDGLVNHVKDDEIMSIVNSTDKESEAARSLIDLANERGGKDNISTIISPRLRDLHNSTLNRGK